MNKRILITGANGQLGAALQVQFPDAVVANKEDLDITDVKSLESYDWTNIDVIVNAAAYTNVDGAETDGREAAWSVNAQAVANLTRTANAHDLTLVHISTDYVFDGTNKNHTEDEAFTPLSAYGASKTAGDIAASLTPKSYILRTSWVIGSGNNFIKIMLMLAEKGINPSVVSDQFGRLTFTSTLAQAIDHLLSTDAQYGTYNITNSGEPAHWADVARLTYEYAGLDTVVTDQTSEDYFKNKPDSAKRPMYSILDLSKAEAAGIILSDWKIELKKYIEELA